MINRVGMEINETGLSLINFRPETRGEKDGITTGSEQPHSIVK
jgi:hypothetical protein